MNKVYVGLLSILAIAVSIAFIKKKEPASQPPNILIVIADQWNAQSFGYAGNADVKTLNLDRLAARSVVFSNAVSVMPVCSPARASLLTGQYPLNHGVFYNDRPLRNDALTLAEIYKEAGYATGSPVPFHENNFMNGGKEYRALRTKQYTYAKDLKGSWLLYDNYKDPYQLKNLAGDPDYAQLEAKLDKTLNDKMHEAKDDFRTADEYMQQWKYRYDAKDSLRIN